VATGDESLFTVVFIIPWRNGVVCFISFIAHTIEAFVCSKRILLLNHLDSHRL
jgi:hypothetical protein